MLTTNSVYRNIFPIIIGKLQSGKRLDQALSNLLPEYSRSQIKCWILNKNVKVNNLVVTIPRKKVIGGELIEINKIFDRNHPPYAQNIPLNIIYEDEDIIIINKGQNIVVHPGFGNYSGTILNGLLYYYPSLEKVCRAGIVHRLDKDTTGLMIVAKNIMTYELLVKLFRMKRVFREYEAIVWGNVIKNTGVITNPIGRHPICRTKMVVHPMGKSAVTNYFVVEKFKMHTRIRVRLETGRTHQIRVHMAHIRHAIVGDKKYGRTKLQVKGISNKLDNFLLYFNRQALHSSILRLYHPTKKVEMEWNAPLPQDMVHLIFMLKNS